MVGFWHWHIPTFIITDISPPWWDFVMVGICWVSMVIMVMIILVCYLAMNKCFESEQYYLSQYLVSFVNCVIIRNGDSAASTSSLPDPERSLSSLKIFHFYEYFQAAHFCWDSISSVPRPQPQHASAPQNLWLCYMTCAVIFLTTCVKNINKMCGWTWFCGWFNLKIRSEAASCYMG